MTGWAAPDQDMMRRIVFQLQRPGLADHQPRRSGSGDGRWHASDGTTDLAAPSLDGLLDELDWLHGFLTRPPPGRPDRPAGSTGIAGERGL